MKQSVDIFYSKFNRHGSTNTCIQHEVDKRHRTAIFFPIDCIPLVPKLPVEIRIMISTTAMGPSPPPRLIRVSMTLTRENSDIAPTANQFFDKDAPEDSIVPLMFDTCNESRNVDAKYYDFCFQRKSTAKSQPAGIFKNQ
jgi:hypothetical protein